MSEAFETFLPRELDAYICSYIFNEEEPPKINDIVEILDIKTQAYTVIDYGTGPYWVMRSFSEDITEAMKVLDLVGCGDIWKIYYSSEGIYVGLIENNPVIDIKYSVARDGVSMDLRMLARMICIVALKAKEQQLGGDLDATSTDPT